MRSRWPRKGGRPLACRQARLDGSSPLLEIGQSIVYAARPPGGNDMFRPWLSSKWTILRRLQRCKTTSFA